MSFDITRARKAGEMFPKTGILFDQSKAGGLKYSYEKIQPTTRGIVSAEAKVAEGQEGPIPAGGGGDLSYPEVISEKTGTYKVTTKKIRSSGDLAQLTDLNNSTQKQKNRLPMLTTPGMGNRP